MKPQVGKSYKTRSGWKADVVYYEEDGDWPLRVRHASASRGYCWHRKDGTCFTGGGRDYDLIAEWNGEGITA